MSTQSIKHDEKDSAGAVSPAPTEMPPLRELRESKGISLEVFSKQTNIPESKLEAFELGDYSSFIADLFVVAYMRKYEKLLDVDLSDYIAVYQAKLPSDYTDVNTVPARESSGSKGESLNPGGKKFNLGAFGFWPVVLVIVVAWVAFVLLSDSSSETSSSQVSSQTDVAGAPTDAIDSTDDLPSSINQSSSPPSPSSVSEASGTVSIREGSLVEGAVVDGAVVDGDAVVDESATSDTAIESVVVESVVETSLNEGVGTETQAGVTPNVEASDNGLEADAELQFSFTERCWLQVKDASGRVLFAGEQEKEDNLQLFGQAPFDVQLGYAQAVSLSINGRDVDIVPRGTSRFLQLAVQP